MFCNLISNALKFAKGGHIDVTVTEVEDNNKPYVKVSVRDNGIGISEKDK